MGNKQQKSTGTVWLILAVSLLGILLLNYGRWLNWDVWWRLLQIWPVAPLAWWIEFSFNRRSNIGSILASLLILVTVLVTVILTVLIPNSTGEVQTLRYVEPKTATQLHVTIKQGVGSLAVRPLTMPGAILTATLHPGRDERVRYRYITSGDRADFYLRARRRFTPAFLSSGQDHRWEIGIQPTVTLTLDASLGEGNYTLDLRELRVARADLNFAIGQLRVLLPRQGRSTIDINGAIGGVELVIPADAPVRVENNTALASLSLSKAFSHHEGTYLSPSCTADVPCTTVNVGVSVGSLAIHEAPPDTP